MRLALIAVVVGALAAPVPVVACAQGDVDGDGLCDEVDPCRNPEPHALREPRLGITRALGGAGTTVQLAGIVPLVDDAPADPAASGLRVVVREGDAASEHVLIDVTIAPGAAWIAGPDRWTYHDPTAVDGIRRATLREIVPLPAYQATRAYVVSIDARVGTVPVPSDELWHHVTVLFAADTPTSRCADQAFRPSYVDPAKPWQLWDGRCRTSLTGTTMRCRSGPLRRPCRVSRAEDELRCLLADVARGQEIYRDAHGTYSSDGTGLLSMPRPTFATFVTAGTVHSFVALAAHADAPGILCTWKSAETPHLTCGPS